MYLEHENIEAYRAAVEYQKHHESLGFEPLSPHSYAKTIEEKASPDQEVRQCL